MLNISAMLRSFAILLLFQHVTCDSLTVSPGDSCLAPDGCSVEDLVGNYDGGEWDWIPVLAQGVLSLTIDANVPGYYKIHTSTGGIILGDLTLTATNGATMTFSVSTLGAIEVTGDLHIGKNTTFATNTLSSCLVRGFTTIVGSTDLSDTATFREGVFVSPIGVLGINGDSTVHLFGNSVMYGSTQGPDTSIQVTGSLTLWANPTLPNPYEAPYNLQGGVQLYIKGGYVPVDFIETFGTNTIWVDSDSSLLIFDGYKAHGNTKLLLFGNVSIWNMEFDKSGNSVVSHYAAGGYSTSSLTVYGTISVAQSDTLIQMLAYTTLNIYWNAAPQLTIELQLGAKANVLRVFTIFNLNVLGGGCTVTAVRDIGNDYGIITLNTLSWQNDITINGGATFLNPITIPDNHLMTITDGPTVFTGAVIVTGSLITSGSITFQSSLWFSGVFSTNGDTSYQSFTATATARYTSSGGEDHFNGAFNCLTAYNGRGDGYVFFSQATTIPTLILSDDFYASFADSVTISTLTLSGEAAIDFDGGTVAINTLTMSDDSFIYVQTVMNVGSTTLNNDAYLYIALSVFTGFVTTHDFSVVHLGNGYINFLHSWDSVINDDATPVPTPSPIEGCGNEVIPARFYGGFAALDNSTFEMTTSALAVITQNSRVESDSSLDISGLMQVHSSSLTITGTGFVGIGGELDMLGTASSLFVVNSGSMIAHGPVVTAGPVVIGYASSNDASNFTGVIHTGSSASLSVNAYSILTAEGSSSFQATVAVQSTATMQIDLGAIVRFYKQLTLFGNVIVMGSLGAVAGYVQSAGRLVMNSGSISGSTLVINAGASLSGTGALAVPTTVYGQISVPVSGVLGVHNVLTLASTSSYTVMIQDSTNFGVLSLLGAAFLHLGGSLNVNFATNTTYGAFNFIAINGFMDGGFATIVPLPDPTTSLYVGREGPIFTLNVVNNVAPSVTPTPAAGGPTLASSTPAPNAPTPSGAESTEDSQSIADAPVEASVGQEGPKVVYAPIPGATPSSTAKSNLSPGAIAGIVVGAIAGVAMIVGAAAWVVRDRSNRFLQMA